ncbi:hypothetical protein [Streptomyces africanus]|uniref:hypothetical protein n=1 Tax=Streptomyces africanus TaxID=231024 RepID=UPI003CC69E47
MSFTEAFAQELRGTRVQVMGAHPGATDTCFFDNNTSRQGKQPRHHLGGATPSPHDRHARHHGSQPQSRFPPCPERQHLNVPGGVKQCRSRNRRWDTRPRRQPLTARHSVG